MRPQPNLKSNVHYWLRKIFLFVWCVDQKEVIIEECIAEKGEKSESKKGEKELDLRERLREKGLLDYPLDKLTKREALEACEELFKMFMEPFEPEVQKFIENPACPGGMPKDYAGPGR